MLPNALDKHSRPSWSSLQSRVDIEGGSASSNAFCVARSPTVAFLINVVESASALVISSARRASRVLILSATSIFERPRATSLTRKETRPWLAASAERPVI